MWLSIEANIRYSLTYKEEKNKVLGIFIVVFWEIFMNAAIPLLISLKGAFWIKKENPDL